MAMRASISGWACRMACVVCWLAPDVVRAVVRDDGQGGGVKRLRDDVGSEAVVVRRAGVGRGAADGRGEPVEGRVHDAGGRVDAERLARGLRPCEGNLAASCSSRSRGRRRASVISVILMSRRAGGARIGERA